MPQADIMAVVEGYINPKTALETVLQDGLSSHFAFSKGYSPRNVPSPRLSIDGLGVLDFPLSERDALALISAAVPKPTPGAESTRSVGVWTIASQKINFANPAWEIWLRCEAGATAVQGLRAERLDGQLEYLLKELTICEGGSQAIHYKVEPDEAPGEKICDLVVLLPSSFTGGLLELRHDGENKPIVLDEESGRKTSIVAAYVGVEHNLSAVESGYRIALTYHVLDRGGHPPTLADLDSPKQRIRRLLRNWQQTKLFGCAPPFIACLLQNQYPRSAKSFDASSLHGVDENLFSRVRQHAQELHIALHLAHIDVEINTIVDDSPLDASVPWIEAKSIAEDSFASVSTEDAESAESLTVVQIVDLDGIPVEVEGLDMVLSDLINGAAATLREPDSTAVDTSECGQMQLTKIFKRTVLLLWPDSTSSLNVSVGDVRELAWTVLNGSNSIAPTSKEKRLVDLLIRWSATAQQDAEMQRVLYLIRQSTERWLDPETFTKAMITCGVHKKVSLIGQEGFVSACRRFGWEAMKDFCTLTATSQPLKVERWEFIMGLWDLAYADQLIEMHTWCHMQQHHMLSALHRLPLDPHDGNWLVDVSIIGGVGFLKNLLYPKLEVQSLPVAQFWCPFLGRLYQNKTRIAPEEPRAVCAFVDQAVEHIVSGLPAFPTNLVNSTEEANPQIILAVIHLCLDTDRFPLCTIIVENMQIKAASGDYMPHCPPWRYFLGTVEGLHSLPEHLGRIEELRPFFAAALVFVLSPLGWAADGRMVFPCSLTRPILKTLMMAAKRVGGAAFLDRIFTIQPELLHRDLHTLRELARCIVAELRPRDGSTTTAIVDAAVDTVGCAGHVEALDLVQFCLEFEAPAATRERLFMRLFSPAEGATVVQHYSEVVVPLLSHLQSGRMPGSADFKNSFIGELVCTALRRFAESCTTPKPPRHLTIEQLRAIGCSNGCKNCLLLREFALDRENTIQFKTLQRERDHLERQLLRYRFEAMGFVWQTIKGRAPYTLHITKPHEISTFTAWHENHFVGKTLLSFLGSAEEQQGVIGEEYHRILSAIEGVEARQPLASLVGMNDQKRVRRGLVDVATERAGKKSRLA
ncbi:hypothetical protein C8R47DRAFT_1114136 [Mycena vitilis]|nr:hypothetical protein C8R47DRAFT_1114136 [Mycena vitilis]